MITSSGLLIVELQHADCPRPTVIIIQRGYVDEHVVVPTYHVEFEMEKSKLINLLKTMLEELQRNS